MRGYLLDTHTAFWWWTGLRRVGSEARDVLEKSGHPIWVSAAAAFEIGLKWQQGKLPELGDPRISYGPLMAQNGFIELAITTAHAMLAGTFDNHHRDPFDRLIAAQALIEELTVVTRDPQIASFGCRVLW